MSKLTSLQRKLVYLGGILLLLIPVVYLGQPPEPASGGRIDPSSGGTLARMRIEYELGEHTIGNVDPASSTMNLLLLGFRGIATSLLWLDAQEQQVNKDWSALRATTDSIIKLQPHFLKVWHFQGWNLAYNVSAEWDAVADRYYWVKEGIKFFKEGVRRNEKHPELYWYTADTLGKKIGRADEWVQFRRFFRQDPDTVRFPNGVDKDINPEGKDNYLVAKSWFLAANDNLDRYHNPQHIMAEILFWSYPMRAQMDYATIRQREGDFDEITRTAWEEAFEDWTQIYGRKQFDSPGGLLRLETTEEEMREIRAQDQTRPERERLENWIARYQDMTNYRFWRLRAQAEGDSEMAEAHRLLYEGEQAYLDADFDKGKTLLWDGMAAFESVLEKYPDLKFDDVTLEEALLAQLNWRECLAIDEEDVPDDYPLKSIWTDTRSQERMTRVEDEFQRRRRQHRDRKKVTPDAGVPAQERS